MVYLYFISRKQFGSTLGEHHSPLYFCSRFPVPSKLDAIRLYIVLRQSSMGERRSPLPFCSRFPVPSKPDAIRLYFALPQSYFYILLSLSLSLLLAGCNPALLPTTYYFPTSYPVFLHFIIHSLPCNSQLFGSICENSMIVSQGINYCLFFYLFQT